MLIRILHICFSLFLAAPMLWSQSERPAEYGLSARQGQLSANESRAQMFLAPSSEQGAMARQYVLREIEASAQRLDGQKIHRKRTKKVLQLLRQEIEGRYLRQYDPLADFSQLFKRGSYNELTAAAFTSMLLSELGLVHRLSYHQRQPLIELADGTDLGIANWGRRRPPGLSSEQEQARLIELCNALELPPQSDLRQSILAPFRSATTKRPLQPVELTGMLYYRQALQFYTQQRYPAALAALERARTYFNDPKLDLVRYAILYQQAGQQAADSLQTEPLLELYEIHPSSEIKTELVRRFAQQAEYWLLHKDDYPALDKLYRQYRQTLAGEAVMLQQLKEIYFIEMAHYYAQQQNTSHVITYLDSLTLYRPNDPQIQHIISQLLVRSLSQQRDPVVGLANIAAYRRDFPFLRSHTMLNDMELSHRAELIRQAFDAGREAEALKSLEAFEQLLSRTGLTPRGPLWITTAYVAASAYYFRMADYPNARWYIRRALDLVPEDDFLLHRLEVLEQY